MILDTIGGLRAFVKRVVAKARRKYEIVIWKLNDDRKQNSALYKILKNEETQKEAEMV